MPTHPDFHAPIPGTVRAPRGLFIDRWGTLLEQPERGFCSRFEHVQFTPGALDALFRAQRANWNLYLIGNETEVAFGALSARSWKRLEEKLLQHLSAHGITIKRCYSCLDHPDGKGKHKNPSVFLLPNTGVMYHAEQMDGINLSESWVIGDSTVELVAGTRAGCKVAGVRTGLRLSDRTFHVDADFEVTDLAEAVNVLVSAEAYSRPA